MFLRVMSIVPSIADNISKKIIESSSEKTKLIANFGAGIDHIDLKAAKNRDSIVIILLGY